MLAGLFGYVNPVVESLMIRKPDPSMGHNPSVHQLTSEHPSETRSYIVLHSFPYGKHQCVLDGLKILTQSYKEVKEEHRYCRSYKEGHQQQDEDAHHCLVCTSLHEREV